ncbi:hypothetical protein MJ581_20450 [Escherichia coli]|nr:hypothetical protein MJ581_20450 [Escherichia coli]
MADVIGCQFIHPTGHYRNNLLAGTLNLLQLGDEEAHYLGVNVLSVNASNYC